EALILRDSTYAVIHRARGTGPVHDALATFKPAVLVVESRWPAWPGALDPARWSGRTLLLLDPEGEPAQFIQAARRRPRGISPAARREKASHWPFTACGRAAPIWIQRCPSRSGEPGPARPVRGSARGSATSWWAWRPAGAARKSVGSMPSHPRPSAITSTTSTRS